VSSRANQPAIAHTVLYVPCQGAVTWYFEYDGYDGRWLGTGLARESLSEGEYEHYPLDIEKLSPKWLAKMGDYLKTVAEKDLARSGSSKPLYPLSVEHTLRAKHRQFTDLCPTCRNGRLVAITRSNTKVDPDNPSTIDRMRCEVCKASYPLPEQVRQSLIRLQDSSPRLMDRLPETLTPPPTRPRYPVVEVKCPRCKRHNSHSSVPSMAEITCAHCKKSFSVCVGQLVGGNRVTIPGIIIWTVHEEFRLRIQGLDGQTYHYAFELPGVGFDCSGGDLLSISFLARKPRVVQNYTTGRFVQVVSSGCILALLAVPFLTAVVLMLLLL